MLAPSSPDVLITPPKQQTWEEDAMAVKGLLHFLFLGFNVRARAEVPMPRLGRDVAVVVGTIFPFTLGLNWRERRGTAKQDWWKFIREGDRRRYLNGVHGPSHIHEGGPESFPFRLDLEFGQWVFR